MRFSFLALAGAMLAISACDAIRVPGDGRKPPEPKAPIPEGAAGPPPPTAPVNDPYGEGEADSDNGAETPTLPRDPEPEEEEPEPEPEPAPIKFQYYAPGDLVPGSGTGTMDAAVYVPDMVFPIKDAPAYPQSQVWRPGGYLGGAGDQCDPSNYQAAWRDNFCETRSKSRNTPLCALNKVHQGQDIRVGTPQECRQMVAMRPDKPQLHEVVAVEDGVIQYIGSYYVQQKGTQTGNIYNYIHLNMGALTVGLGDAVTAGQSLGYVSNDFGGVPTTFHLHFEIKAPLEGQGIVHVPPYMSLLRAYERREEGRGEEIVDDTISIASIPIIPDDLVIIE